MNKENEAVSCVRAMTIELLKTLSLHLGSFLNDTPNEENPSVWADDVVYYSKCVLGAAAELYTSATTAKDLLCPGDEANSKEVVEV